LYYICNKTKKHNLTFTKPNHFFMKKLSLLLGAFMCIVVGAMAQGTTCATAVTVTAGTAAAPAPYSAVAATGTGASGLHAAGAGGGAVPAASRWYKYVAAASGNITISSCGSTTGADTRLWVMSGTCAALVDVAGDDDNCGTPTDMIYLSTLTMPVTAGTTYYFEWDDTWEPAAFTWTLAFSSAPPYDARLNSATQEYTVMPITQIAPIALGGNVTNLGSNALAAAKVTATVFSGATVVQTYTSPTAALASNASANFAAGTWTPPATAANYTIQYVVSHTNSASDALATNDTIRYPFSVSADIMARDNGVRAGGLGVGGTATAAVKVRQGQEFRINAAGTLTSVDVQIGGGRTGDTIQLEIYTVTAGVVSAAPILSVPQQILAAPAPGVLNIPLPTPLAVTAGTTYMVSLLHSARGTNIGMGYSNAIFTANKAWIKTNATAAWAHPESVGFPLAYMIRLHLPAPGADVATTGLGAQEYTILPVLEITPQTLSAKVKNNGTVVASTTLTVNVTNSATSAVVYTNTSAATNLAIGATQTISCGSWTPPATPGIFYDITYIAKVTGDINVLNDTIFSFIGVAASTYARDSGNPAGGLGIAGTATTVTRVIQGNEYAFPNAARIDSVTYLIGGGRVGDSIRAEVYLVTAGVVGAAPVATSAYNVLTATTGGVKTLALTTPFAVTPGATYLVALWHGARGTNIALQYDNNIFTPNKMWIKATGVAAGAWSHPEAFGFSMAYIVRPNVICPVVTATATTPTVITCATPSAVLTATGGATYAWSGGGTAATKTVTAGGVYTVTVSTAAGCTGTATVTVDVNNTPPTLTGTVVGSTGSNGSVTTIATPTSTYVWNTGATTAAITGLAAGTYTVTATAANGCTVTRSFVVLVIGTESAGNVSSFNAYPNPTNGTLNIVYTLQNAEKVRIELVNALGQTVATKDINSAAQYNEQMDLTAYPSGVYFVKMQVGETRLTQRITLQK
jgi:Secretion system C-terminal sorting domain